MWFSLFKQCRVPKGNLALQLTEGSLISDYIWHVMGMGQQWVHQACTFFRAHSASVILSHLHSRQEECVGGCGGRWPLTPFVFCCKCSTCSRQRKASILFTTARRPREQQAGLSLQQGGTQMSVCDVHDRCHVAMFNAAVSWRGGGIQVRQRGC